MSRSIEQLEKRLQLEQDALSRADLFGNEIAQALYREGVARAERALHEARLRNGDY
jgi:hypothetical protein